MSVPSNIPVIGKDALDREVKDLTKISWWGLNRKEIEWFPKIDLNKCAGCGICFVSCGRRVFDFDTSLEKPVVAQPYNCMVGCQTCANLCPTSAISFPDSNEIKKMVSKNNVVKKAFEKIQPLLKKTNLSEKEIKTTPNE